jgi:hypothetical protein
MQKTLFLCCCIHCCMHSHLRRPCKKHCFPASPLVWWPLPSKGCCLICCMVVAQQRVCMPQCDPKAKHQSIEWRSKNSTRPKKPQMSKSEVRTMLIFFNIGISSTSVSSTKRRLCLDHMYFLTWFHSCSGFDKLFREMTKALGTL